MANRDKSKKEKKDQKVTRASNMADVIFRYPEVAEVLTFYGLHCAGCAFSAADTIEEGAKIHGLTDEDIDKMVDEMNEMIELENSGLGSDSEAN